MITHDMTLTLTFAGLNFKGITEIKPNKRKSISFKQSIIQYRFSLRLKEAKHFLHDII